MEKTCPNPHPLGCFPDEHLISVGRTAFCCKNGDPTCCDYKKDEKCPKDCNDCEVKRNYVRALKTYIADDHWKAMNVDWSVEPNWVDLYICKCTETQASRFINCLSSAGSNRAEVSKDLQECFNSNLPDWATYVQSYTHRQETRDEKTRTEIPTLAVPYI